MPSLADFRLVGGTALTLLQSHRKSDDIDLFTHQLYGTIDFEKIESVLQESFSYVRNDDRLLEVSLPDNKYGLHLHIGETEATSIKTDILNWNEDFLYPAQEIDGYAWQPLRSLHS